MPPSPSDRSLLKLPQELLEQILESLPVESLPACSLTHSLLRNAIASSISLQYRVHLHVAGKDDNPHCIVPIVYRLAAIKSLEKSWFDLKPIASQSVECPPHSGALYDLPCGIMILGDIRRRSLSYLDLSCALSEWKKITWDGDGILVDFGVSLQEHDLIILVLAELNPPLIGLTIVISSLSSGGSHHPQARLPRIPLQDWHIAENFGGLPDAAINIHGEKVAILISSRQMLQDKVYIFNWKTGDLCWESPAVGWSSVLFLTDDILLVPNVEIGAFDVFRIPGTGADPSFYHLAFPSISAGYRALYVGCRMEPISSASSRLPIRPSHDSPAEALILVFLQIWHEDDPTKSRLVSMIVHRKTLEGLFRAFEDGKPLEPKVELEASAEDTEIGFETDEEESESTWSNPEVSYIDYDAIVPTIVPWDEWGPQVVYTFVSNDMGRWITATCGQRYATLVGKRLTILDFNPCAVRARGAGDGTTGDPGEEEEPAFYSSISDDCFENEVLSKLPLTVYQSETKSEWSTVLMDEEYVLGIYVSDDGNIYKMEVLHFE